MLKLKSLLLLLACCCLFACSKRDTMDIVEDIPGLGGDTWKQGTIDKYLYDSLTAPFNVAVKYKWDQFEFEVNKTLVPPKEEKVIPVVEAIRKVWISTYIAEADSLFFKKYCPKFLILSGSASWNANGTITLGTAEGGRKVVLYLINEFRTKTMPGYKLSDSATVKQMFHVIEHEFGHILHQNTMYPVDFKRVTPGLYTGNWNNISDAAAHRDGFVTAYAMSGFDDDFVEMISMMLVEGKAGFDKIVNSIPAGNSTNGTPQATAKASLRAKEAIVVNYFDKVWHIDFYSLQNRTRTEIEKLLY
ncbi:substrate import-associated zinc metallohydrolase lipoprotein [Chitinophaga dinghuensis]|uniref:Substrate import-associated zinc metallohydrolase lipoprotein n=1 Tax=Chitinophaga dinghuensis TaxID=1539050 RepID=A0A327VST6_9BACT|nr:putative zinc-binding metallopeptidase [Chitinophaga dinghuensis]RAJ77437.1 substrate import-associated zinc metallohydrolase lipoprotein [Chitinophaga dinghuensis]